MCLGFIPIRHVRVVRRDGLGATVASRGVNWNANSVSFPPIYNETVLFGTVEMLSLVEGITGQNVPSEPLITVNTLTGTPQEAADWVRAINVDGFISPYTGLRFPNVTYWYISAKVV
jgi:hypothetical protein